MGRGAAREFQAGVGLLGADVLAVGNLNHHFPLSTFRFPLNRFQLVADAGGVGRAVLDEEGAVGTEACGAAFEVGGAETEGEHVVEHPQGEGGVAAAATEAGTEGNMLLQADVDGGNGELVVEETPGTDAEVVLGGVVEGDAGRGQARRTRRATRRSVCLGQLGDLQLVAEVRDREEEGLQVVVAVGSAAYDMQAEVNLAVWVGCHRRG